MKKERVVILFGAGAAISWKGPTTAELTELIKKSGFFTKNGEKRITDFIFDILTDPEKGNFQKDDVNFETIINVLEELLVYYSNHCTSQPKTSLLFNFLKPKCESEIMNFSVEKSLGSRYHLNIPGMSREQRPLSKHGENPKQFFLQVLLLHLYSYIETTISEYSLFEGQKINRLDEEESKLDQLFCNWIGELLRTSIIRMYTLNYEANFKHILENHFEGLKFLDGFHGFHDFHDSEELSPKPPKPREILTDFNSNCHYNLHGSIYWKVQSESHNGFRIPNITKVPYPSLSINNDHPIIQNEKGKSILSTGIITGYQKLQKGAITPFRQMKFAFDRDTITADKLFVIGYSFGDEHINAAIGEAIKSNPTLKLIIVDPGFMKNDLNIIIRTLGHYGNKPLRPPVSLQNQHSHLFNGEKLMVNCCYFREFLNDTYGYKQEI